MPLLPELFTSVALVVSFISNKGLLVGPFVCFIALKLGFVIMFACVSGLDVKL